MSRQPRSPGEPRRAASPVGVGGAEVAADWLTVPNALSLARILAIPPFLAFYLSGRVTVAAVLFGAAAVTDLLDGLLARLLNQRSALGAVLDPVADKALGLASLAAVVLHGQLPAWLLWLSLGRDGVVLAIALVARSRGQGLPIHPSRVGKYATFFLNGSVILALAWEISYAPWLLGYVRAVALVAGECVAVAAVQYLFRFAVSGSGR